MKIPKFDTFMNDQVDKSRSRPLIWDPNAAANWSVLFSLAFGAILHAMNWAELGYPDKAKANKTWAWVYIVFILLLLFIPINLGIYGGIGILACWYFSQGRPQIKYVKKKYGKEYDKKSLDKPLLIALGCLVGYVLFSSIIAEIYSGLFGTSLE